MTIDPGTRCDHVRLVVPRLEQSVAFYEEMIGLRPIDRSGGEARLGVGAEAILHLVERPNAPRPPPRSTGLFHFAILLPTRRDLARILRHLIDRQAPFQGFSDHRVSEAIYLADLDGNGIELYRDRPRETWRDESGQVTMTTDPLDVRGLLAEADEADFAFDGLADGTILGHVHLKVAQIAASERFYSDVLGFELMTRYGAQASFVAAGGYHHHIGMNTWQSLGGPAPPPGALGLERSVMRMPDATALEAVRARLEAAGIPVETSDGGVVVADPSSNRLQIGIAKAY